MTFEHSVTDHQLENEYPKLIRDRIPEIIQANDGRAAMTRTLDDDKEFLSYLLRKVVEEAEELSKAETDHNLQEEIADVYEIIDTIIRLKGMSAADIAAIQDAKREKRGGFEKRLLMLEKAS
jgi:predicted house-cleaning noncanonical NTP pyrophosphatase (MazG superfamily)